MAGAIAADGRIVIVGGGLGGARACQRARPRLSAPLAVDNPADVAQARVAIGSGIVPDVARLADPSTPIREL
jgi:Reductase C-terminal